MPPVLPLGPDELLSTTRSVRKRLDLSRDVEPELVTECLELATQAPTGGNAQGWHFIVVRDADKRRQLGEWYRQGFEMMYGDPEAAVSALPKDDPTYVEATRRVIDSATYLSQHMGEVPVQVIPVIHGRTDSAPVAMQAGVWGSLLPAVWSFMLAARARALGTSWTSMHLARERDVADILGLDYETVAQAVLTPVAYTKGTDFQPARRPAPDEVIRWI
jgi:nitroreductase